VRLLEHGLVDFEPIVTHRFPAARFEEAVTVLEQRQGTVAKVLLEHVAES
jgi:threonine dehydrogenase-like Zn-dependent dehydrogenase